MEPPTTAQSAVSQSYAAQYHHAWTLYESGKSEEAFQVCRRWLMDPGVGLWYQAGFHLILSHSYDCYVEHAEQAAKLYRAFYELEVVPLTDKDKADCLRCLQHAEIILKERQEKDALEQAALQAAQDTSIDDKDENQDDDLLDELVYVADSDEGSDEENDSTADAETSEDEEDTDEDDDISLKGATCPNAHLYVARFMNVGSIEQGKDGSYRIKNKAGKMVGTVVAEFFNVTGSSAIFYNISKATTKKEEGEKRQKEREQGKYVEREEEAEDLVSDDKVMYES